MRSKIHTHAEGELLETLKEWRKTGRMGMNEADHFNTKFSPNSPKLWSKKELRSRITYLRKEREEIFSGVLPFDNIRGKRHVSKEAALAENSRKRAKYTKELFRRESARNQKAEREEYNAKRRRKRAAAKRKMQKVLVDKWNADRRESRKLLKEQPK